MYDLIGWPEIQKYMDLPGFDENSSLADAEQYGACAYFVDTDWLAEQQNLSIEIEYSGKWPNLCAGHLKVMINNTVYDFTGGNNLCSGGWTNRKTGKIGQGPWVWESLDPKAFPPGFPMYLQERVLEEINDKVYHGCCGGCIK